MSQDCKAPGCGDVSYELVNTETGAVQVLDPRLVVSSWQKAKNAPTQAVISSIDLGISDPWCCPWDLEPFCRILRIYRDGCILGEALFTSLIRDPNTGNDVLYFNSYMAIYLSRVWLSAQQFTSSSTDAFSRVLDEAERCDPLPLSRQPTQVDEEAVVSAPLLTSLAAPISKLVSGTLDYTETYQEGLGAVIRYGNIYYDTGYKMTASDWEGNSPQIGFDGSNVASAVIVTNRDNEGNDRVLGYWPQNEDGSIAKDQQKLWIPEVLVVSDVASNEEATAIARREYSRSRSGNFINLSGAAALSRTFGQCVTDLDVGAVFDVELDSSCFSASGKYAVESMRFDYDGGIEDVSMSLRELTL